MILKQNSRAPKILSPFFLVKKGKVVGHPFKRMLNSRPLRLFWNPQHHLLGGWVVSRPASQLSHPSFTVESTGMFSIARRCVPTAVYPISMRRTGNGTEADDGVNSHRRMIVESKRWKWYNKWPKPVDGLIKLPGTNIALEKTASFFKQRNRPTISFQGVLLLVSRSVMIKSLYFVLGMPGFATKQVINKSSVGFLPLPSREVSQLWNPKAIGP